jgi:hypothetical protein
MCQLGNKCYNIATAVYIARETVKLCENNRHSFTYNEYFVTISTTCGFWIDDQIYWTPRYSV